VNFLGRLSCPWAIVIAGVMIAAAIIIVGGANLMSVATIFLVVLTFLGVRLTHQLVWFTGAMERHSDQQRQIAAKNAGIEMIWWDKNEPAAGGHFPHEGAHGEVNELKRIYIGIPVEHRKPLPTAWQRVRSLLKI
jgi:hypothetical protein